MSLASAGLSFWTRPSATSWRRRAGPGGSPPSAKKSVSKRIRALPLYVFVRGWSSDVRARGDVAQMLEQGDVTQMLEQRGM